MFDNQDISYSEIPVPRIVEGQYFRRDGYRSRWRHWTVRFWDHVEKSEGCWNWTGDSTPDGYGRISCDGNRTSTHRASWVMHNGEIPDGLYVCHHCDNKKCIRPDHLFLGTQIDNMQDWTRKGKNVLINHPERLPRGESHYMKSEEARKKHSDLRKDEWASGQRVPIRDERGRIMGTQMRKAG